MFFSCFPRGMRKLPNHRFLSEDAGGGGGGQGYNPVSEKQDKTITIDITAHLQKPRTCANY